MSGPKPKRISAAAWEWLASLPVRPEEVGECDVCGRRVVWRRLDGAAVAWDPTAVQRRWVRSILSARDGLLGPPWGWGFGRIHECPPPCEAPAEHHELLRQLDDDDDDCGDDGAADGGGP